MTRQIHLTAFIMASHMAHSGATWRHPAARTDILNASYYQEIGRILERGRFDAMFFGDSLSTPARYRSSIATALEHGSQAAVLLDPRVVLPIVAAATSRLGLATTASTTYSAPFDLARLFATLDHMSEGRVGWNVVTSTAQTDAQNFGFEEHLEHDARYDRADEFLELVYRLWGSWEPGALLQDRENGRFADGGLVHRVDHAGEFYNVRGPLTVPRSPQERPVIFQAGSSARGRDFAARWAEAVFVVNPTSAGRQDFYQDLRSRVDAYGRDPNQVKVLSAIMPFVGASEAMAKEHKAMHDDLVDPLTGLIMLSNLTDHDFSDYALDEPVANVDVPGVKGLFAVAQMLSETEKLTLGDVAKLYGTSQLIPTVVGTGVEIADQIEAMVANNEADGLMISPPHLPGGLAAFVDLVVPELQRRGLFRREYEGRTLRDHLGLGPSSLTPPPRP